MDGNFEGDCNVNCIDRGNVWCPDDDLKTGACFKNDEYIKMKVNARGSGNVDFCSNKFDKFEMMKYSACPIQNYCDDKEHKRIYIPSKDV